MARKVQRVMPEHQASRGILGSKATRASRVSRGNRAMTERTAIRDHLVILVKEEISANKENLESQVYPGLREDRAIQAPLERRESGVRLAPRVPLARQETRVCPALRAESVRGARRVRRATLDLREYRESPVPRANPVSSARPV